MLIYRLADLFLKEGLEYAIVGGWAVALHGAVRGTVDIDIILKLDKKSFLKAQILLGDLNLKSRLPVDAAQVFDFRTEYIKNRNLIAWSFVNLDKPSEVVDIIITHDLKKMEIHKVKTSGHTLAILGMDDLIKMKKESGRPQDLEDVIALQGIKKR
jgi:hypothetical protein